MNRLSYWGGYRSALHVYYAEPFQRIDLYGFDDEMSASAVAAEIPPDAVCYKNGVSIGAPSYHTSSAVH